MKKAKISLLICSVVMFLIGCCVYSDNEFWYISIIFFVVGSILSVVSMLLEKREHQEIEEEIEFSEKQIIIRKNGNEYRFFKDESEFEKLLREVEERKCNTMTENCSAMTNSHPQERQKDTK